jgi:hypothetical protein
MTNGFANQEKCCCKRFRGFTPPPVYCAETFDARGANICIATYDTGTSNFKKTMILTTDSDERAATYFFAPKQNKKAASRLQGYHDYDK